MTPKEKAIELVDKYGTYVVMWTGGIEVERQNCKQCALIAVDEIIEATKTEIDRPDYNGVVLDKYWQEVKTELEKLY